MKPRISVIIPIYKAEAYLQKCLDSVKCQTLQDWEAILVDDGSPDGSGKICDAYSAEDKRFKTLHKRNAGVGAARQTGLDMAIGEYVTHVDPDDWIEPEMFEELFSFAKQTEADIVLFDYFLETNGKKQMFKQTPSNFEPETLMSELFKGKVFGSCWSKLVRRSIFTEKVIRFRDDLQLGEDTYITACLFIHNLKVVHKNKAYYHYIRDINPNALTKIAGQSYAYDVRLRDLFDDLLKNHPCREDVYRFFCGKIVSRAYSRKEFDSLQFMLHCLRYVNCLKAFCLRERIIYTLSCLGFYGLCYNSEQFVRQLIKK